MIDIYKKEVLEYLEKNNISYVEDSTNSENEYTRNKIRNVVFPYIENEMGYNLQKSFITLSNTIREEEEFLDDYVTEIIVEECLYDNENHPKKISIGMEKLTNIYEFYFKNKKGMLKRFIKDIAYLILKNVGNKKIIINGLEFGIKNKRFYVSKYNKYN